jgi:hypothetical protein
MIAGPNGSGKSTLFDFLRTKTSFPLGHCLNPDVVERELAESGKFAFDDWNLKVDQGEFESFVRSHGLSAKVVGHEVVIRDNVLIAPAGGAPGRAWRAGGQDRSAISALARPAAGRRSTE